MSIGCFTEKGARPTDAQVQEAIGARLALWDALAEFVRAGYPVEEDFKFLYGKNYGWASRFRVKGQLLVNLYPAQGGFTAQINLSPAAVEQALGMGLGQNAQQAIARAHPYPEGRWLFIPVASEDDLRDVQRLLSLRAETKRLH
jgi:hypothetical protein